MINRLSLRQLRAFALVARHQSFVRAARELHLTQPAVSMQIRELEATVGLPLLERSGKSFCLTAAGEALLMHTRAAFAALKDAEDAIARLRGLQSGRVVIGMVGTAQYFLPRLLARFRERHPAIELRLQVGNRRELVRALHDNEVDLAVMGRPPPELATHAAVFADNPLAIVAAASHPLAARRKLEARWLRDEAFIVREPGSGTRAAMEQFFREQGLAPPIAMETSGNETIKQAVMANMGLAFLSLHTVAQECRLGQLAVLHVEGLPVLRHWHLVQLQARTMSPASEAVRAFILEDGGKLLKTLSPTAVRRAGRRGARRS